MDSNYFFYRKFGKTQFVRTKPVDSLKDLSVVLVKTSDDLQCPTAYCPCHRLWENVQKISRHSVVLSCGYKLKGLLLQFYEDKTSYSSRSFFRKAEDEIWDSVEINDTKLYAFGKDAVENQSCSITDYNQRLINLYNDINTQEKLDENCISKDVFAFSINVNETSCIVSIKGYVLDADKITSSVFNYNQKIPYKTYEYRYNLKEGVSDYINKQGIPVEVVAFAKKIFLKLYKKITGINITVNTCFEGEECLDYLLQCPFEPNLAQVINTLSIYDYDTDLFKVFNEIRLNPDCYNVLCKAMGIKSYRTLRKLFMKNPLCLYVYYKLKQNKCFEDVNIMNQVLEMPIVQEYILDRNDSFIFFIQQCSREKSELRTLKVLRKLERNYITTDSLYMFSNYYTHIDAYTRNAIYKEGFTVYNHDLLSRISQEAESENVTFAYSEEQKKLEDSIDSYDFCLPVDSHQLIDIGTSMHNCVASYKKKVIEKQCTILYARKDNKYQICIEIRGDTVWQQRGDYNSTLTGIDELVMEKYNKKHGLLFVGNRF